MGERRHVVVLAGGDPVRPPLPRPLAGVDRVIAADAGYATAAVLGLEVDLLIGDLDSIAATDLATARARGTRIEQHPADKDRTDLALALDAALADGPARVTVVGGHGGRLDHLLANVALLAADRYAPLTVTALLGAAVVTIVRDRAELTGRPGGLVTLLAAHRPAEGVTTTGLAYPLTDALLEPGSSLGVSNRCTQSTATVTVARGTVVVVQPEELDRT
ncbi:MAG: thiamine diphosphokinase [Nitriliruptoraceae bacterium]